MDCFFHLVTGWSLITLGDDFSITEGEKNNHTSQTRYAQVSVKPWGDSPLTCPRAP